jgi:phosphoribosylamine-glycine ligase
MGNRTRKGDFLFGKDLRTAQVAAYAAVECIQSEGAHFCRYIAAKAF